MNKFSIITLIFFSIINSFAQEKQIKLNTKEIPSVLSGVMSDSKDSLYFISVKTGDTSWINNSSPFYTLDNIRINPAGTDKGLFFDFNNKDFYGIVYFGMYPNNPSRYPQPVLFNKNSKIIQGKAEIDLSVLKGKYDIANLAEIGKAKLGYRIVNNYGAIIYDGVINIRETGPFTVDTTIISGPFVNIITENSATISFETNYSCVPIIEVSGSEYSTKESDTNHEIIVTNLEPATDYTYKVQYGNNQLVFSLKTAPKSGSKAPFTFAYTSDSRYGAGGGERNIYGVNAYIMKRMAALALSENASFFQFTGDMINGYSSSIGQTNLEYANWKRSVTPYWHHIPFYIGAGNHEALTNVFNNGTSYGISVDKFPYDKNSAEQLFSKNFVNPLNGPISEDGAYYDPNSKKVDFPKYGETVYYYTYGNIAMVVLNSNYWYTPTISMIPEIGGNPLSYIMDNQLDWFRKTIEKLDSNSDIDHIFVTIHTPAFPNGGHANKDMWYFGNNNIRPTVAGIPVNKGIIERRDEFLDIMINKSNKVAILLCGDEHNYSRMKITNKTNMYPENYSGKKLKVSRPLWQITNGSAGAPYYGQEILPWSESVNFFSTQYALTLFDIDGEKIRLRVINPDTLEEIEEVHLTQ